MSFAGYAKIGDIKGGSTQKGHEDQCELLWIGHVMRQPGSLSRSLEGGGATGNVEHGEWKFKKQLDCASPKLAEALNKGTHIDKVVVELCRPGGDPLTYMKFSLAGVLVTSMSLEGNAAGDSVYPVEDVGLTYTSIEWEYDKMDEKGKSKGKVATKYSLATRSAG